jgi:predicted DNA-binding transcriptional regulator YafY
VDSHRSDEIDAAFQALAELSVLRFRYRDDYAEGKGGKHDASARVTLHPYALVLHGGSLVCVGRDVDRDQTRAFVFDRMGELVASEDERFELPDDFDVSDWLQGEFGVARASRTVRLLVEFEPRVADAVRARRVLPSQLLAVAADGRVRASLNVPESPEVLALVRSWILGFGAGARLVEPRELADEVAAELRRAAARYVPGT